MKRKPTEDEKEKELHHLRHVETSILTISATLMATGLTLYVSTEINSDLHNASFLMFGFALFFSINHIRAILLRTITPRINAFIYDIGFFLLLIDIYVATFFSRHILPFFDIEPTSSLGVLFPIVIIILGLIFISWYVSEKVVPTIRKNIFPKLAYHKHLDNPLVGKSRVFNTKKKKK